MLLGLILGFIGCMGLGKADEDPDYSILRFLIPYVLGFGLAFGG